MKKRKKKPTPKCPKCGAIAHRHITSTGVRYYHCNYWAWGKYPLVDKETHKLRKLVHLRFDPIWLSGIITRKNAYMELADRLNIPIYKCHMKTMDKDLLRKALEVAEDIATEYL